MNKFISYKPSEKLRPFVDQIVISENSNEAGYKVLPQTSLVMGFQYRGRLLHVDNSGERMLDPAGITGLFSTYRTFKNISNTGTVLVYFRVGGIPAFIREPANELFGQSTSLQNFFRKTELEFLEEQLYACDSDQQRISAVEKFLLSHVRTLKSDYLVQNALNLIYQSKGTIRVHELNSKLNISESPFEKRFRAVVGSSAKKFTNVVRMQFLIDQGKTYKSFTELALDAEFYDQSHFNRQFKAFTGYAPETFFSESTAR